MQIEELHHHRHHHSFGDVMNWANEHQDQITHVASAAKAEYDAAHLQELHHHHHHPFHHANNWIHQHQDQIAHVA